MVKNSSGPQQKTAPIVRNKPIQKQGGQSPKTKQFKSMRDKLKKRGFSERVSDKSDKEAICGYLNDEIHRHVKHLQDQRNKSMAAYAAEKTRIRRQARQEQSERAKNAQSEKTKAEIDQKKEEAYKQLAERKNADESKLQLDLVHNLNTALGELESEETLFS